MTITVYLPLIIALIGWVIWALCSGVTVKGAFAKLGEVCLYAGMFAFLFAVASKVIHF